MWKKFKVHRAEAIERQLDAPASAVVGVPGKAPTAAIAVAIARIGNAALPFLG
jgi:hypothetical protein